MTQFLAKNIRANTRNLPETARSVVEEVKLIGGSSRLEKIVERTSKSKVNFNLPVQSCIETLLVFSKFFLSLTGSALQAISTSEKSTLIPREQKKNVFFWGDRKIQPKANPLISILKRNQGRLIKGFSKQFLFELCILVLILVMVDLVIWIEAITLKTERIPTRFLSRLCLSIFSGNWRLAFYLIKNAVFLASLMLFISKIFGNYDAGSLCLVYFLVFVKFSTWGNKTISDLPFFNSCIEIA